MVTTPELSKFVEQLNRAPGSMARPVRAMREAGLISQSGHGKGAAQANYLDGTRMLIAGMLGRRPVPRETVELVSHYGSLPCREDFVLMGYPTIFAGDRFEDALVKLLNFVAFQTEDSMKNEDFPPITIRLHFSAQTASIEFNGFVHFGFVDLEPHENTYIDFHSEINAIALIPMAFAIADGQE